MTKELPYAIAPDGAVIQLTLVLPHASNPCSECYMDPICSIVKSAELAEMVGSRCEDYDNDEDRLLAVWKKI
jgi:hypothetical protein